MSALLENPIDFIKTLKSEHKSIISILHEIDSQQSGPSDLKGSVEKLNKITDLLFDHLEREDKHLYPVLLGDKITSDVAKKYSYDMERLSCIAVDFYKRYCINREGLKIFIEDFINGYTLFKGLLKVRIKREEVELYPAYILIQSGVLQSEVVNFIQEQEDKVFSKQKKVLIFGHQEAYLKALELALEICGYKVIPTSTPNQASSLIPMLNPDLVLLDVTDPNKELKDLIFHLKEKHGQITPIVGYSTLETKSCEENLTKQLDAFISKPAYNMESFSEKVKELIDTNGK